MVHRSIINLSSLNTFEEGSPHDVMVSVLNYDILVSEFAFKSVPLRKEWMLLSPQLWIK